MTPAEAQALNVVMHRRLCEHEAAHAAAALIGGLDVREAWAGYHDVTVKPSDPDQAAGHVLIAVDRDDPGEVREHAITVLAGPMCDDACWPPRWPLSLAPTTHDERALVEDAKSLALDKAGYAELVADAYERITSREFSLLAMGVGELLERGHRLDAQALKAAHTIAAKAGMEHLTLKAVTTTTTDEGTFSAVISTAAADRENDVVVPAAMVEALQAWNRPIPLDWNHSKDPADIVGHITPAAVKAVGDEVVAEGEVDLDTERGRHVFRLMKRRSIGFSFAYMITDAVKRIDGIREIRKLDVFAVTATPTPMNNGTKVLSTKAIDAHAEMREKARREMFELLTAEPEPVATKSVDLPVQVASFEC